MQALDLLSEHDIKVTADFVPFESRHAAIIFRLNFRHATLITAQLRPAYMGAHPAACCFSSLTSVGRRNSWKRRYRPCGAVRITICRAVSSRRLCASWLSRPALTRSICEKLMLR